MRTAVCKWCGKTFSYNKIKGTKSYCCAECRRASQAETERQRKKEREELARCTKELNEEKNAELRKMAVEALERGMSYGEYSRIYDAEKRRD